MKTPEEWSREIYDKCPCQVMGRSMVTPEFVAKIQADAKQSAYREIHARLPMPQYQSDPMTPREVKNLVDFICAGMSND